MNRNISRCWILSLLIAPAAFAFPYANNFHEIQDPGSATMLRGIKPIPIGSRYVAEIVDVSVLPAPNARPLLVDLDLNLKLISAFVYRRPCEASPNGCQTRLYVRPHDLYPTRDGGTMICGDYVETDPNGGTISGGAFLLRTDAIGNVMIFREFPAIDHFESVIQLTATLQNGIDFVACGWRRPTGGTPQSAILVATDAIGNPIIVEEWWGTKLQVRYAARFEQVVENRAAPGTVVLVGSANRRINGSGELFDSDVLILERRLFPNGFNIAVLGDTNVGPYGIVEQGKSIAQRVDLSGWVIGGAIEANCIQATTACGPVSTLYRDVLALRINGGLTLLWSNRYDYLGNDDLGRQIADDPDRITLSGDTGTGGARDVVLLRLDHLGGAPLPGSERFGGALDEFAADVYIPQPPDQLHAILGASSTSFGPAYPVPYLVERFAQACRNCLDRQDLPTPVPTPLPLQGFTFETFVTEGLVVALERVRIEPQTTILCRRCLLGDMNDDGFVTPADIPDFVLTLLAMPVPGCLQSADVNCDGGINGLDIQPFLDLLL